MRLNTNLHTRYLRGIAVTGLALTLALSSGVRVEANQRFIDIPTSHWAFDAVMSMSDQGFMVANSAGEFRPNAPLDKFETARILANIAGFRVVGATPEQQALQTRALDNHYGFLADMDARFANWSNASNHEIALLLELGVLTPNDVQNFLVVTQQGEQLRALSRQEAAVFLTRVFGFGPTAAAGVHAELFSDDMSIDPAARHYVYFLRAQGVIAGDGTGAFSPGDFVTRAALSIMTYRTQELTADAQVAPPTPPLTPVPPIGTVPGPATPVPPVNLPGTVTTTPPQATPAAPAEVPTQPVRLYVPRPASNYTTLQGTLVRMTATDVIVRVRFMDAGELVNQQDMLFPLALNSNFFIGSTDVDPHQLNVGDVLTVHVAQGQVFEVHALEPNRAFSAVVTGRTQVGQVNTFTVRDAHGASHQLVTNNATVIERAGTGGRVTWDQIRLGDSVELVIEGQTIQSMFAFGQSTTVDGYVQSLIIRADLSELVLRTNNQDTTYYITGTLTGLASLSVGDRVRLRLDSLEIEGFTLLN